MTAEEYLFAFRRFVGRRGAPKLVVSDNAPEFEVVDDAFQDKWRRFAEATQNQKYYAEHGIEWRYIPPGAPWMGGAYERLIREVKRAFQKIYGNAVLFERQFEAAIIEVEGIVNSRPITYQDRNNETELLSPNDFLCLKYPAVPIDFEKIPQDHILQFCWKAGEEYLEQFWKIWSEMYLMDIRERRIKPLPRGQKDAARTPEIGEIVLMIDPMRKRGKWRLAVVERLITSSDGKIRAAQIRAGRSRMIRSVTHLASLKLLMEPPEDSGELITNKKVIVHDDTAGEIDLNPQPDHLVVDETPGLLEPESEAEDEPTTPPAETEQLEPMAEDIPVAEEEAPILVPAKPKSARRKKRKGLQVVVVDDTPGEITL